MITFSYIEDYIEYIGGYRDASGKMYSIFDTVPVPIKLARYDVKIISSLASQTVELNRGYTDRQAELAVKIVNKYRRQLAQLPTPIMTPINEPRYRIPLRVIDRTKKVYIRGDKIILQFPFIPDLITLIKNQVYAGNGSGAFDNENKIWRMGITESTIEWVFSIADKFELEIDSQVHALYQLILECKRTPFKICLVDTGKNFDIENASEYLKEYINCKLGGFEYENVLTLIDNSSVLGYLVDQTILNEFKDKYGYDQLTIDCITNNRIAFDTNLVGLEQVIEYAELTNRLPVYVYSQNTKFVDSKKVKYLKQESANGPIRCLVSDSQILVGTKRQSWFKSAEKVFYIE